MLNVNEFRKEIKKARSIDKAKLIAYYLLGYTSATEQRLWEIKRGTDRIRHSARLALKAAKRRNLKVSLLKKR